MLRPGTQDAMIRAKVNMPTAKSHAELVRDVEPKLKAQAFFSARVAEAHILDRLREVSDGYSRGEFGLGEARNRLKDFLRGEGYDPHQAGIRNLASTARLNLILKQQAAMANAAAEWQRMHSPEAMKVFPYVRYHASVGSKKPRDSHQKYDGMIFRKDDPFLRTHTPPWDFGCHCELEEITEKEAGRTPDLIRAPTPEDKVTVDSESGFSFDPEHAFEKFDMSSIKDADLQASTHAGLLNFCQKGNCHFQLMTDPEFSANQGIHEPDNIDEIKRVISEVNEKLDAGINPRDIEVIDYSKATKINQKGEQVNGKCSTRNEKCNLWGDKNRRKRDSGSS